MLVKGFVSVIMILNRDFKKSALKIIFWLCCPQLMFTHCTGLCLQSYIKVFYSQFNYIITNYFGKYIQKFCPKYI